MADIHVRPKSAATIWWIFGIVALALLLWAVFGWDTGERILTSWSVVDASLAEILPLRSVSDGVRA